MYIERNMTAATTGLLQGGRTVEILQTVQLPGFVMSFTKDEEIFGEGETANFVYRVVSGSVRIYRILEDGRRQISSFCFPGDVFGLELDAVHGASAEAVTACEVALVTQNTLQRAAACDRTAASLLLRLTCRQLCEAREHMVVLGRKTAMERLVTFLRDMAVRSECGCLVKLPMSRADIADFLGLTIETVSRTLTQLERTGQLTLESTREIRLSRSLLADGEAVH
jgi:CRP/FNR family nitrogen fixation transcriptional regulator